MDRKDERWTSTLHIPLTVSLVTDGQKKTLILLDQTLCATRANWVLSYLQNRRLCKEINLMLIVIIDLRYIDVTVINVKVAMQLL